MTAKTKLHYAVLMILMAFITIQAVAEEKKETQNKTPKKQELKFRAKTANPNHNTVIGKLMRQEKYPYIAEFYATNLPTLLKIGSRSLHASGDWAKNVIYEEIDSSEWINALLASKAAKKITESHKTLIAKGEVITVANMRTTHLAQFRVFAYNNSDAKCTVEAIIEVLNDYAETARNKLPETINRWQKELAEAGKTHEKLKKEREQATESLEKTKKQAHYLSVDEANGRIKELNVYLDKERIEIAGIAAGLQAMQGYLEKAKKGGGTKELEKAAALEAKMIDQMIELATVKAKYEAAEGTRAQAEGFVSLTSRLANLKKEIKNFPRMIASRKEKLDIAKTMLLIPAADLFTPKIEPAIATIYAQAEPSQK